MKKYGHAWTAPYRLSRWLHPRYDAEHSEIYSYICLLVQRSTGAWPATAPYCAWNTVRALTRDTYFTPKEDMLVVLRRSSISIKATQVHALGHADGGWRGVGAVADRQRNRQNQTRCYLTLDSPKSQLVCMRMCCCARRPVGRHRRWDGGAPQRHN